MARSALEDPVIARTMRTFFRTLPLRGRNVRNDPAKVAQLYAQYMSNEDRAATLVARTRGDRYSIGLSAHPGGLDLLTRRSLLIADSLLISHARTGVYSRLREAHPRYLAPGATGTAGYSTRSPTVPESGFICPNLTELGEWLLGAQRLLTSGLVTYIPSLATKTGSGEITFRDPALLAWPGVTDNPDSTVAPEPSEAPRGPATDEADFPESSLKPLLHLNMPFVDQLDIRQFSEITARELDAYRGFRLFLRKKLLEISDLMESESRAASRTALLTLENEIQQGLHEAELTLREARKGRLKEAAALAAVPSAALFTVQAQDLQGTLAELTPLLLAGTAVGAVITYLQKTKPESQEKNRLRKEGWYYIWLLRDAHRRGHPYRVVPGTVV